MFVLIIIIILVLYFGFKIIKKKKSKKLTNVYYNINTLNTVTTININEQPIITFKINPQAKVTVYNIYKNVNVIVIDDFLLNIDQLSSESNFKKLTAIDIPRDPNHPYPGIQYPIELNNINETEKLVKKFVGNKLIKFNETKIASDKVFSVAKKFKTNNPWTTNPHTDVETRYSYAAMLFLNKPNDCYGGTGIYKSKIINNVYPYMNDKMVSDDINKKMYKTSEVIKDTNDKWKLIHLLKMKYNRLVIYESCLFHSIYLDSFNLFKKDRYTFNIWFDSPNVEI